MCQQPLKRQTRWDRCSEGSQPRIMRRSGRLAVGAAEAFQSTGIFMHRLNACDAAVNTTSLQKNELKTQSMIRISDVPDKLSMLAYMRSWQV
jgi:hypothetical protein